LEMES